MPYKSSLYRIPRLESVENDASDTRHNRQCTGRPYRRTDSEGGRCSRERTVREHSQELHKSAATVLVVVPSIELLSIAGAARGRDGLRGRAFLIISKPHHGSYRFEWRCGWLSICGELLGRGSIETLWESSLSLPHSLVRFDQHAGATF